MRPCPSSRTLLPLVGILLSACGGSNHSSGNAAELAPIRLTHSPPVATLDPHQLRSLSMECEKHPSHSSMRGRYDAAYCEEAIAAWGDSPLQMVIIDR
ncbi:MAG: hypothetical protein ABJC66_15295 [Gammaproteobacteria bacterium]